ncbi:hypothetical protein DFJ43DRAFT_645406 [Lentinula guzmanii]|uniref:Sld7 C-terminal domain-containing protein n=2 Tax=Lentinula TaxID=5352 RepID=A0AA38JE76_9AGAR|nr:hypothetical protein DFJ43DRAFT_645406 [Lentinula guzmanii]KAJ3981648.1 hypothetical protein F5890DRAFT_507434 [Lentinula detonsa]
MSSPSRPTHRLLYRGSLSLPDSDLTLDGLTFSARINAGHNLLENPLALDLESMRGRPTLRFMGVTSLKEIHMDDSGDITLDIHPDAILSRIYFENVFCLPSTSDDILGIRIALGDSGPDTTQIIVFLKSVSNGDDPKETLCVLSVARVTPMPVARPRLPRPDDPTPRKPPLVLFGKAPDLRRVASFNASNDLARKRKKISNGSILANLGSDVRLGQKYTLEGTFKIPSLPAKNPKVDASRTKEKDKGKGKATVVDDVFGSENLVAGSSSGGKRKVENKGKRKRDNEEGIVVDETLQETENKTRIKRSVVHQLTKHHIPKTHSEFKDIYHYAYHGVAFALRADMKIGPIEEQTMERLVLNHVGMYAGANATSSLS